MGVPVRRERVMEIGKGRGKEGEGVGKKGEGNAEKGKSEEGWQRG